MADDVVIASELDLEAILAPLARAKRMVFFADCPGVGKSLFIRELARLHIWPAERSICYSGTMWSRCWPDREYSMGAIEREAAAWFDKV